MIRISRVQRDRLARFAEAAWPGECCGLLVGRADEKGDLAVARLADSPNLAPTRDRFEIDPGLWLRLEHDLGGGPDSVIGLYHSHPNGTSRPSAADRAAAWRTGWIWLILALRDGKTAEIAAHRRTRDGFDEIGIGYVEESAP